MPRIIGDHFPEGNGFIQGGGPLLIQFGFFDLPDQVDEMMVHRNPEADQSVPVLLLVILDGYPAVVVSKISIVGILHRTLLLMHMDYPVGIIGGGIHHVSQDLPDTSSLGVLPPCNSILWECCQDGFPFPGQVLQFFTDPFKFPDHSLRHFGSGFASYRYHFKG